MCDEIVSENCMNGGCNFTRNIFYSAIALPPKPVTGLPQKPDAHPRRAVWHRDGDIIGHKSAKIDECNVGFKLLQRMGYV